VCGLCHFGIRNGSGFEPPRLMGLPTEVSAHCATGASCLNARERSLCGESRVRTKYPRASPLAITGGLCSFTIGCLDSAEERTRLLVASDCEQKPGRSDAALVGGPHRIELEVDGHSGFLCLRYSATGCGKRSRGKLKINLFVSVKRTYYPEHYIALS
jgi:hypothetical protein